LQAGSEVANAKDPAWIIDFSEPKNHPRAIERAASELHDDERRAIRQRRSS